MNHRAVKIHPTAIVEPGAELGLGVEIGPYSIVGSNVVLGDDVYLSSHVVISNHTTIGARSKVWPFATLGALPQDLKYKGEKTVLICGEDNMFREYCNVSIGTEGGGAKTVIGSKNLFMNFTHVAHDCIIGNSCIFANGVALAGHIEIADRALIGGLAAVHQFVRIGSYAMIAAGSMVAQDVPPFVMVAGDRARPTGINKIGIQRGGYDALALANIKKAYKILYLSSSPLDEAKQTLSSLAPTATEIQLLVDFLNRSERGICR